jgi:hypothetical protein
MTTKSIQEIRAELLKEQQKANNNAAGGQRSYGASASYPFWDAPKNSTTVVRFLPDSDPSRVYFWRERQVIGIPFASVEGHPELSNVIVEVPCVKMYNKKNVCPILQDTRNMWNTDEEHIARLYYPKKSYLYQGFVVSGELQEAEVPENPIRRFIVNKSIHKVIESALADPEMDANPVDMEFGLDFRIIKTQTGQYADYGTSSFARRSRALSEAERAAVEQYGLFDLGEFLPREPDAEMMDVIVAMYQESRKPNSQYKLEWSKFYTPKGARLNVSNSTKPTTTVDDADDENVSRNTATAAPQVAQESASTSSVDIMAEIRSRMGNLNN